MPPNQPSQYPVPPQLQPPQPGAEPPQPNQNPYDFIVNSKPQKPKTTSLRTRVLIVAGGAALLLIAVIVFSSLVFKPNTTEDQALLSIAAEQTELQRVAAIGEQQAKTTDVKNLAITVDLTMQSRSQQITSLLKKRHFKFKTSQLNAKKDTSTDSKLTDAQSANNFDEVFTQTIKDQLTTYQNDVRNLHNNSTAVSTRTILNDAFTDTGQFSVSLAGDSGALN